MRNFFTKNEDELSIFYLIIQHFYTFQKPYASYLTSCVLIMYKTPHFFPRANVQSEDSSPLTHSNIMLNFTTKKHPKENPSFGCYVTVLMLRLSFAQFAVNVFPTKTSFGHHDRQMVHQICNFVPCFGNVRVFSRDNNFGTFFPNFF